MSNICALCSQLLPTDGKFLTCMLCKRGYHLGKNCSAVTEGTYTKMSIERREAWSCQACKQSGAATSDASFSHQLTSVSQKLDQLTTTVGALVVKVEELLVFKSTAERLAETVGEVQKSIEFLSTKYDSVLSAVSDNQAELGKLRAHCESLSTVSAQAATIHSMNTEINALEQFTRRCNFEIHGLPVERNENLMSILGKVAGKLGIEFQPSDVAVVHRLPARMDSIPAIIVQAHTVAIKQKWLDARKGLPKLVLDGMVPNPRLYFNDNLTRANRDLFRQARMRGREKEYKFVWTRDGKVLARKAEGSPLVRIDTLMDLEKLV